MHRASDGREDPIYNSYEVHNDRGWDRLKDERNIEKFGDAYKDFMRRIPGINLLAGIIKSARERRSEYGSRESEEKRLSKTHSPRLAERRETNFEGIRREGLHVYLSLPCVWIYLS